jgi:hypothetical protein
VRTNLPPLQVTSNRVHHRTMPREMNVEPSTPSLPAGYAGILLSPVVDGTAQTAGYDVRGIGGHGLVNTEVPSRRRGPLGPTASSGRSSVTASLRRPADYPFGGWRPAFEATKGGPSGQLEPPEVSSGGDDQAAHPTPPARMEASIDPAKSAFRFRPMRDLRSRSPSEQSPADRQTGRESSAEKGGKQSDDPHHYHRAYESRAVAAPP